MGKMRINCPFCNAGLAAEYEWAGEMLECPDCHQSFVCPVAGEYASYGNNYHSYPPPGNPNPFGAPPPNFQGQGQPYNNSPYNNSPYNNSPYQRYYGAPAERANMFTALKNIRFEGRASRREFWLFSIFNQLMLFSIGFFTVLLGGVDAIVIAGILAFLWSLITLLPSIAVTVRRCHDTGRSGWWIWICLIPIIGPILLVITLCSASQLGDNMYGPNPNGAWPDEAWPAVVGVVISLLFCLL